MKKNEKFGRHDVVEVLEKHIDHKKYKHTQWFTIYVVAEDIFQVQYSENSVKTEGKQKTTRYSQKLQTKKL